ncbi:MAG: hypothetical protein ABI539_06435 [Acidobacteriota bacterium]
MYRRPKFLEVLIEIRQEMAREADYDVDLFAQIVRGGGARVRPAMRHPLLETDLTAENKSAAKGKRPTERRAR